MSKRLLHVMLRVKDLDKTLDFYCTVLGMSLIRKRLSNRKIHIGLCRIWIEEKDTVLEFTHNWETDDYELGTAYGHIAINVDDVFQACEEIEKGGNIVRPPGPMKHSSTIPLLLKIRMDIK